MSIDNQRLVLDDFPCTIDEEKVKAACHVIEPDDIARVHELCVEAQAIARPRAAVVMAMVEIVDDETVRIDGVEVRSRLVRVNLDKVHRVFAFTATCSTELEEWSRQYEDDLLDQFCTDEIKKQYLVQAMMAAQQTVAERFLPDGKISRMNPGSLEAWPLTGQRELFQILGDAATKAGVLLTPSYLMQPGKSVSGLFFSDTTGYVNCIMCPMPACPNRQAPYDSDHYRKRFEQTPT